jgi:hypothetical protein
MFRIMQQGRHAHVRHDGGQPGRPRGRTHWLRRLVISSMVVATVAIAAPADAYQSSSSGYPGTTQVPVTQGHRPLPGGPVTIIFPQRFVWRSSSYPQHTQILSLTYRIYVYDASRGWVLVRQSAESRTVAPGYSGAWFGGTAQSLGVNVVEGSFYATDVTAHWQFTNGALMGTSYYDYVHAGDYQCLSYYCQLSTRGGQYGLYLTGF